jgi:hypothetical protein
MSWRRANAALVVLMVVLWCGATFTGQIGNTTFIGHVSMLALVLGALSAWRSDVPTDDTHE